MDWYYADNGVQRGPVPDGELQDLVLKGAIGADTLVWHEGMRAWQPYSEVAGTAEAARTAVEAGSVDGTVATEPASDTGTCSECGGTFPVENMVKYESALVCAACKPAFFQKLREGATVAGNVEYAGFWIRFLAKFVDNLIVGAVNMVFSLVFMFAGATGVSASNSAAAHYAMQALVWLLQMTVAASYTTFFIGRFGQTPGKMACKVKVVRSNMEPMTYSRALGRFFGEWLSQLTCYIGYIMAAFDEEKRALHDRICDTRVIRID